MLDNALRGSLPKSELAIMALMWVSMSSTDKSGGMNLDRSSASFNSLCARSSLFASVNILAASV